MEGHFCNLQFSTLCKKKNFEEAVSMNFTVY